MKRILFILGFIFAAISIYGQLIPVQNDGAGMTGTWNILVIPVEFNNWAHNQPISSTYNPYYAPVEISDLDDRYNTFAKEYYAMASRGKVNVNFHVFPQWINMGNMTSYAGSAFAPTSLLTGAINAYNNRYSAVPGWNPEVQYDKTIIAFAGPVYQDEWAHEWEGTAWNINQFIWAIAYLAGDNGKANCISIYSGVGVITHEMGHALFNLKDKDVSSRVPNYRYQLMGAGAWNGCDALDPFAYQANDIYKNVVPSPIEPWIRVNLGWERQPLAFSAGEEESMLLLAPVADPETVNDTENYRNLIAVSAGNSYYLLENRQHSIDLTASQNVDWNLPNSKSWDLALPTEGILVWKITDAWRSNSGSDSNYSSISQLWSEVIDTNPSTTTLPSNYRYRYIDGQDSSIGPRTSVFNDHSSGYNILGKYDAPIALGQSFTLPGTSVVISYEERYPDGSAHVRLSNVNNSINDPAPNFAQPVLSVSPELFDLNMGPEEEQNLPLTISNTGEAGSVLAYTIQLSETQARRSGEETVIIGNGTDYLPRPFDAWNSRGRSASLVTSAEIGRTGLITRLGWSVRKPRSYSLPIKIWVKHTTLTALSTSSWNTNDATLVYEGSEAFNTTGWKTIVISAFDYTGGNLLVLTEANFGGSGTASTVQFNNGADATAKQVWNRDTGSYSVDAKRPNIAITFGPNHQLSLLQPNGGEIWRVGEQREIIWESTGEIPQVEISVSYNGGGNWQSVASSYANSGSYLWTVPEQLSEQCLMLVAASHDPSINAQSAGYFEIQEFVPGFQFLNVDPGQRFLNGSTYILNWNTIGDIPNVKLELSGDNGQNWEQIYNGVNLGACEWQVWHLCGANYRLRISNLSDQQVLELSPVFEIYQDFNWLNASALEGNLEAGASNIISLSISSYDLYPGDYQAFIRVAGANQEQIVPVLLTVTAGGQLPSPENLRIGLLNGQIILAWDSIPGAAYRIYGADNPDGEYQLLGSTDNNTWTEAAQAKQFYQIRATNNRIK